MADNVMLNVNPSFDLDVFAGELADMYRAKGYSVSVANINGSSRITFDKGIGGINTFLGLSEGIKATCMVINGGLSISFSDAEWSSKIIGLGVGWFLCFIPFITAIVGSMNQLQLPKSIANDAMMLASNM